MISDGFNWVPIAFSAEDVCIADGQIYQGKGIMLRPTCTAAHTTQGISLAPGAHLEMVHDGCAQTWCWVEQAADGDDKVDLVGTDT